MKVEYGYTSIACRSCGKLTVIDNKTLESITEHKCPFCGQPMTDREMAFMKMHLYFLWTDMYQKHFGTLIPMFEYCIELNPHMVENMVESEENGNQEGV